MKGHMKQNKITNDLFDLTKSISSGYQTGGLYGRLLELKDMQIYIQKRINEIETQIDEVAHDKR
jgi:hypothetical protein